MPLIEFKNLPDTTTPLNANNLNNNFIEMFNLIYPVGSIYMSMNSTNPSTLFGGTWEQLKARFLCGVGTLDTTNSSSFYGNTPNTYTIFENETGGENFHSLTENELATHDHKGLRWNGSNGTPFVYTGVSGSETAFDLADPGKTASVDYSSTAKLVSEPAGAGWGHNNMPPYFAVYMWKRTA